MPRATGARARLMTMMAGKRSPISRVAGDYSQETAAKRIDVVGAATGARPAHIGSYSPDPAMVAGLPTQCECLELLGCHGAGKVRKLAGIAAAALCGELSPGSAIADGEWAGARERLGRSRPALRKEASWTG